MLRRNGHFVAGEALQSVRVAKTLRWKGGKVMVTDGPFAETREQLTARLRVLFVLVVLAHHRRRVVHFNVTEHPTAAWTAQQIVETFPDDSAPAYLLRDRDQVYGQPFRHRVKGMRIAEVLTASQSPWQNPFVERLIGSIRRECLNHVLVLSDRHLRRVLIRYSSYYHRARTHLSLDKDAPEVRPIEPPPLGAIIPIPEVGGLHHRYVRRAA